MKGEQVIYVDAKGAEHGALVRALNGLNPGYVTVVYVDVNAPEGDNLKTVFDVPHMDDDVNKESNPALPTIHLNCWKERWTEHTAPASDHPMFDHPFTEKEKDEFGRVVEAERPEYAAQVAAHQDGALGDTTEGATDPVTPPPDPSPDNGASLPSASDLDIVADEQKAKEATDAPPVV